MLVIGFLYLFFIISFTLFVNKYTNFLSLRYPTIAGFYYCFFLIMCLSMIFPSVVDKHRLTPGYFIFITSLVLHTIFFLFGVLLASNKNSKPKILVNKIDNIQSSKTILDIIKSLKIISVFLFLHMVFYVDSIPIVNLIKMGSNADVYAETIIQKEALFKKSIGINNYLWNLNRQVFVPIVVLFYFVKYFKTKTKRNFYVFCLYFIFGLLNNSLSGSLAPVALLFLMLGITYVYLTKKFRMVYYIYIALSSVLFPIFIDFIATQNNSIYESSLETIDKTMNRFSTEVYERTLDYFNTFGINYPFLNGRTHRIFAFFSGQEYFNVANFIFVQNLPERKLFYASTGNQNAHFISYMYSDFGLVGIIISSFVVGFLVCKIQNLSTRFMNNDINFVGYIVIVTIFWKLMGVQPFTIFFSHGVALILVIMYITNRLVSKRRVKK